MKKVFEKYGLVNVLISSACIMVFLLNSILVSKDTLLAINENIAAAYALNFFGGWEGLLGKWGSMSYAACFENLQLWRVFTYIYLHAGVIHMAVNLAALLMVGKYVEKRLGSEVYASVFHVIAIVEAVIVTFFYTAGNSVGASAGIFGIIGIAFVMCLKKQLKFRKSEIIYLIVFILLSSVMGTESLVRHLFALALGIVFGFVVIRNDSPSFVG